jgi:hexokinase
MFLALDLGGTNFRVILLELSEGAVIQEKVKHYHIGEELRLGCGERLFDFLAECVSDFVRRQNLNGMRLPLGKYCFRGTNNLDDLVRNLMVTLDLVMLLFLLKYNNSL